VKVPELQERARQEWQALKDGGEPILWVGLATCGLAAGAGEVIEVVQAELAKLGITAQIVPTGCIGACFAEPMLDIEKPGLPRITYGNVTPEKAREIIRSHLVEGAPRADLAMGTLGEGSIPGIPRLFALPMFAPQVRIATRNAGLINPEDITHYLAAGGYTGLERTLTMDPEEVVAEITKSGLRGRGGAGFPTGAKWRFARQAEGDPKYLICNADEGDPGAFMDRAVLESDPHSVLEGMLIAAYAIGATEGFIYVRSEYPLAIQRLSIALDQMHENGLLGEGLAGSSFNFGITLKEGAGAFVCGEETAMIASLEGRRGQPRPRPPFPATSGLWGNPTTINNVETLANVPAIMAKGAAWFASYGTEKSKGTKTFALTGKVERSGLIEVPMGITLGEVIHAVGGGIPNQRALKAVQTGGPSGGCIPASLSDLTVEYESLAQAGSIMGSGGLVVLDEDTCVVDIARYFLSFTQRESCGKCPPCRLGTKQMLAILEDFCAGKGTPEELDLLVELAEAVKLGALCGLGQTAPNPVLSTVRYFRDEYEAHINHKRCPAGVCRELIQYAILDGICTGCGRCKRECPVQCIAGERKATHVIDQALCIKCGTCREVCKFGALEVR